MRTGSLEPVSNREDFQLIRQCIDTETGEAIDLTDAEIVFEICRKECGTPVLTASIDNGKISLVGEEDNNDTYEVDFTAEEMSGLCAETYDVFLRLRRDDFTTQIIIGTLPVLYGGSNGS